MIVGIDPDLKKSGVCFYKGDRDFDLKSLSLFDLVDVIKEHPDWIYCIEDVCSKSPTFPRNIKNAKSRRAVEANISQKVGMVKAVATLIEEAVRRYADNEPVMVKPGINSTYKGNAELFNKATGWTGRSNEDTRDAWAIAVAGQTTCRLKTASMDKK